MEEPAALSKGAEVDLALDLCPRPVLTSTADPWLYWGQAFSFKFIPTVIVAEHQTGQMALRGLCYYM